MLRSTLWEVFEWLFILSVLIGAVVGVALYTTAWIVLLPLRLATARRAADIDAQPLQECHSQPCTLPAVRTFSKAA